MFFLMATLLGNVDTMANSRSVCATLVAETKTEAKIAADRFSVGEVNFTVVSRANLDLLSVQFDCRAIIFDDYCKMAPGLAKVRLQGLLDDAKSGMGSPSDIVAARKELAVIEGLCR